MTLSRSLNVAFVCWSGQVGGAETFTVELAAALRARDLDARIVFVCGGGILASRADALGVPWVSLGLKRGRGVLRNSRTFAAMLREQGRDAAVLVSSGFLAATARVGGYSSPLVAVEHGAFLQTQRLALLSGAVRRLDRRSGLWACSVEVAVSEYLLQEMRKVRHAPLLVCIPNGVDVTRFSPSQEGFLSDRIVVGCAARLVAGKGVDDLLRAAAELRGTEARWLIAGDGPERPALEALAEELELSEAVDFCGRVDDMPEFWRGSSIAVVPSSDGPESFGIVAIEAMASGVPVVATRNGGLVEIIGDGDESGILVEPRRPSELARAIRSLMDSSELRSKIGANARRRVEQRYSLGTSANAYANLLKGLIEHSARRLRKGTFDVRVG